jgi:hypothetical protein
MNHFEPLHPRVMPAAPALCTACPNTAAVINGPYAVSGPQSPPLIFILRVTVLALRGRFNGVHGFFAEVVTGEDRRSGRRRLSHRRRWCTFHHVLMTKFRPTSSEFVEEKNLSDWISVYKYRLISVFGPAAGRVQLADNPQLPSPSRRTLLRL